MKHYPHHIGDFDKATRHLTRLERSVYRDLIDMYYDTEQQIPLDLPSVCRKIIATSNEESTAVEQVLNEFFTETPTGWFHERCEEEISKYRANNSQKAQAGKASAAKKALKKQQALDARSTDVEQTNNGTPTNQEPSTINQEPNKETTRKRSAGFDAKKINLPEWLEQVVWDLWCDARLEQKKPIGKIAAEQQIKQLEAHRKQGHSPRSVIEHSVAGGYQGLFPPNKPKGAAADADSQEWFETRRGVEWKAGELGIGKWNEGEEHWPVYKQRVMQAEKDSHNPGISFDQLVALAKKHEGARA